MLDLTRVPYILLDLYECLRFSRLILRYNSAVLLVVGQVPINSEVLIVILLILEFTGPTYPNSYPFSLPTLTTREQTLE